MSLSLTGGASAAAVAHVDGHQPFDSLTNPNIMLGEEEISDVSLSTFYVFDKENAVERGLGVQLARGCGGCGRCGGCRGGGRCGGCRGGCRCGGGCGWGGCGGCGCGVGCCISWGRCRWWC